MASTATTAVIGAGPYGLSIAAHLASQGIAARIFGPPMASWRDGMPRGMRLKSEGFASALSDPHGAFTLKQFCAENDIPYGDLDVPVSVETFTDYGEAFRQKFVPQLDTRRVAHVARAPHGFKLTLEDGTCVDVRRVIIATGVAPFKHIPAVLAGLTPSRLTHTCEHADYAAFAGKRVVVIGAGASAVDAAAALQRGGAIASLVSRRAEIRFHAGAARRGLRQRLVAPITPLGPGWKKLFCVRAPLVFRLLPARLRRRLVTRYLGPAPGWFAREDFVGKVEVHLSSRLIAARETTDGVALEIAGPDGGRTLEVDHVVAGTGYGVDIARLAFLDRDIVGAIACEAAAPRLSPSFETSVPGLYVAGPAAAFTFGPLLRFVCGAGFAARRITAHVAAQERPLERRSGQDRPAGASFQLDGSPAC